LDLKSDGDTTMTKQTSCNYEGDRADALIAYLYGEDAEDRRVFEAHLAACAVCRDELEAMGGVRAHLSHWAPPEPLGALTRREAPVRVGRGRGRALAEIPAWAQIAAASLIIGVSVGIANVHVQYGDGGLTIRSGWMADRAPAAEPAEPAEPEDREPWRGELAALRGELASELAAVRTAAVQEAQAGREDPDELMRQVRALITESDRRHQRELALRVGEAMRDLSTQRRVDLVNIDRSLGTMQNNLGMEMLKQREQLNNYVLRVSSQK
jgi:hypothetical protein